MPRLTVDPDLLRIATYSNTAASDRVTTPRASRTVASSLRVFLLNHRPAVEVIVSADFSIGKSDQPSSQLGLSPPSSPTLIIAEAAIIEPRAESPSG
jgi:hypothetical protein